MKLRILGLLLAACAGLGLGQTAWSAEPAVTTAALTWSSLAQDELHDPEGPALHLLQNPAEALSHLPRTDSGSLVNWSKALKNGSIKPLAKFYPQTQVKMLDQDIMLTKRESAELNRVIFPHKQHTEWLDCSSCHEKLFKSQAGANQITMLAILNGESCGRCHGAVAFPPTDCKRCHNAPRTSLSVPAKKQ